MPRLVKIVIGFAAALLAGWIVHGPLGRGALFVDSLQAQSEAVLREAAVPGVTVAFPRDPLTRVATLSGPANDFQREGQGTLPGINGRILDVPGVAGISWTDADSAPRGFPLLAETLALVALAFLVGLGIGRLVFGRRKREGFL